MNQVESWYIMIDRAYEKAGRHRCGFVNALERNYEEARCTQPVTDNSRYCYLHDKYMKGLSEPLYKATTISIDLIKARIRRRRMKKW